MVNPKLLLCQVMEDKGETVPDDVVREYKKDGVEYVETTGLIFKASREKGMFFKVKGREGWTRLLDPAGAEE